MNPLEEHPGRSAANRSLLRGADILRAFRPGSDLLGNSEIAERTGLSNSTVSRLTQTLVAAGLLQQDRARRAYRLAPLVLSLGHAMRSGSQVLAIAAPRMRALAERERINVGLAYPDRDEMVYLESIRYNRRVALRNVVSGQRVPMELTSLGRAYLATVPDERYALLEPIFRKRNGRHWPEIRRAIETSTDHMKSKGYCWASWQPEVLALATAFPSSEGICVINVSMSTQEQPERWIRTLAPHLLRLKEDICLELSKLPEP
ncbi:IclR family transcriptional regulator [Hydrogenophaga sp. NH-16]|uniref:IclR family transcriptional regulator n=1 Tax=Hydrogenophaga sp. NH-16 TaxID=2184519 RepID=UPI000FDCCAD1|nr:IclR family transcriptional regulator [Hydrogenophaga sp. NH-16]